MSASKTGAEARAAAQRVANQLCGSCTTFTDAIIADEPALAGMDSYQARILIEQEGEIFLCEACGWWCEVEEMHDSGNGHVCNDCNEER